jgi:hypothetical protein
MKNYQPRIGILYPVDYLDIVPCVRNTIVMLAKSGFLVEVFSLEGEWVHRAELGGSGIIIHTLSRKDQRGWPLARVPNLPVFTAWAIRESRDRDFSCFIGVDPPGLVAAALLGTVYHKPWVYFSLELIIKSDPVRMYKRYKPLETWCSQRSSLIIIQDEARARLMAEDNHIPMDRFVFLPNSPLGPAHRQKTDFLHKRFGFGSGDKILLHAGSVGDEFLSRELALASREFPDNWRLAFHCRGIPSTHESCFGDLLRKGRLVVSSQVIPYSVLRELISSADIGIALYNLPQSPNFVYIGKASGKLCQYLQCGLPVIVTRMPGWEEALRHHRSGISVDSPSEIKAAAEQIFADYDYFSQGALAHFEEELRFEPAFAKVASRLANLV